MEKAIRNRDQETIGDLICRLRGHAIYMQGFAGALNNTAMNVLANQIKSCLNRLEKQLVMHRYFDAEHLKQVDFFNEE